ncbi:hypothetical protein ACMYYO_00950 [Dermacoccaceae bacterium W4C1]
MQLTHLRIAVSGEQAIELAASDEAGVALPGAGKGAQVDPVLDKLSALIELMNEKYGADLDEADKIWIDQQKQELRLDEDMKVVALNNDRSQYELVLANKVKDLLVSRHEKNGHLFDLFFSSPEFQQVLMNHLADTYDEFRASS